MEHFKPPLPLPKSQSKTSLRQTAFESPTNRDGVPDLLIASSSRVIVLLGKGDGRPPGRKRSSSRTKQLRTLALNS